MLAGYRSSDRPDDLEKWLSRSHILDTRYGSKFEIYEHQSLTTCTLVSRLTSKFEIAILKIRKITANSRRRAVVRKSRQKIAKFPLQIRVSMPDEWPNSGRIQPLFIPKPLDFARSPKFFFILRIPKIRYKTTGVGLPSDSAEIPPIGASQNTYGFRSTVHPWEKRPVKTWLPFLVISMKNDREWKIQHATSPL